MSNVVNITSIDELLTELKAQRTKREEQTIINILPDNKLYLKEALPLKNLSNIMIDSKNLYASGIDFSGAENISLSNITIDASRADIKEVITSNSSNRIYLQYIDFIGGNNQQGLAISYEKIDDITISNCTFSGFRDAISIRNGSSNIIITDNTFTNIGRDAIGIHDCNHVQILENEIYDFHPNYEGFEAIELSKIDDTAYLPKTFPKNCNYETLKASSVLADHADCIQFTNSNYVTISENKMGARQDQDEKDSTWTQSIFIQHNMQNYPSDNYLTITQNTIRNRHMHGISIEGYHADDVTIDDNDLIYSASEEYCYYNSEVSVPIITEKYI